MEKKLILSERNHNKDNINLTRNSVAYNRGVADFIDENTGELLNINEKDMKFQGMPKLYDEIRQNTELSDYLFDKMNAYISTQE